jgi:hypothetical protein
MPDTDLPPGGPCQAPSLLRSPPALKQATRAFRLAGDRIAIGARGSPGASSNAGEGEISSLREAGSTALSSSVIIFGPWRNGRKVSRRLQVGNNTARDFAAASCETSGQQKRNIIHISSTAYEQDHSGAHPSFDNQARTEYGSSRSNASCTEVRSRSKTDMPGSCDAGCRELTSSSGSGAVVSAALKIVC